MNTRKIEDMKEAASLLLEGEVVAFPTETVYGLGALATCDNAIGKIFTAKGRPSDNPLIVHIASEKQLEQVVKEVSEDARTLMKAFWPGPLTIVLPKAAGISNVTTAGLETVGVRVPSHPVALALLKEVNQPIAAPSANISGRPSPTKAVHVMEDLAGKIPAVVDGGACEVGLESTVIDCSGKRPVILRPGHVTQEEIEALIGPVSLSNPDVENSPKSPGMKYKHYAPKAPLVLIDGDEQAFLTAISKERELGKTVGILCPLEEMGQQQVEVEIPFGSLHKDKSFSFDLYDALRKSDEFEVDIIFVKLNSQIQKDVALMNRLYKASGGKIQR